jgi:hypothetical protein
MMASAFLSRYAELIRVIMKSEDLDELPQAALGPGRASLLSVILKAESLPFDDAEPAGKRSPHGSGLFASEVLPLDDRHEPLDNRASFIARLFSRETLPVDPIPGPGPGGRGPGR